MIASVTQRWRRGPAAYRPMGETIATREHDVASISKDAPAKAFISAHHYEGSYPAASKPCPRFDVPAPSAGRGAR